MSEAERVRWRCRRGMLELDLILLRFFESRYGELDAASRRAFEALLSLEDHRLLAMIEGREAAPAGTLAELIGQLRTC